MQRYFIHEMIDEKNVTVSGDDFHHMTRVMRMEVGDRFFGVVHTDTALIEIDAILEQSLRGRIIEWVDEAKELPIQVSIANGLPKGDKLEWVIQKGTELGAHAFIPFMATRSIVKWDAKKAAKKTERLRKIAKEAAEQYSEYRDGLVMTAGPIEAMADNLATQSLSIACSRWRETLTISLSLMRKRPNKEKACGLSRP